MERQVLRDPNGNRLGTIEVQSNEVRVFRDANGNRLEYEPDSDLTRAPNGNRLGIGDQLASLL